MYIKKLFLQDFGNYHKREIELQKGINLIYGPNEAGKSTIRDFIIGMFYGIERQRGIAARTDDYVRREPFGANGYSGSLEVCKAGEDYLIDRVFQKEHRSCQVYQQKTGRKINLPDTQSLQGILLDLDKNGYTNTLCISSQGAAYKQELQEQLRQYLANVNVTKAGNLDLRDAYNYLQDQKKRLNRKGLEGELQGIRRELKDVRLEEGLEKLAAERILWEERLLEASCQSGQTKEAGEVTGEKKQKEKQESSVWKLSEEEKKIIDPQLKGILSFIKVLFAFGLFALLLLVIFMLPVSMHYKGWLCVIAVVVTLYIWFMIKTGNGKHSKKKAKEKQRAAEEKKPAAEPSHNKEMQETKEKILEYSRRLTDLQVQENELLEEYANQQELKKHYAEVKKQIEEADIQLKAIELAAETIQELSNTIYDRYGPGLNRSVSAMVGRITEGKYTDVRLDEQLTVKVRSDNRYLGAEFLSTGTLEQIYLAVRLAVAEEISDAGMPLLLDDIFGSYDDNRLLAALKCIADYPAEQTVIFTAGERLADALDKTDIDYNYIEL